MATEDKLNDYDFSGTDAGASHTIPSEAGQIRKGGYIVIKGHPCKVRSEIVQVWQREGFPWGSGNLRWLLPSRNRKEGVFLCITKFTTAGDVSVL